MSSITDQIKQDVANNKILQSSIDCSLHLEGDFFWLDAFQCHRFDNIILDDDINDAKTGLIAKWPWMRDLSPARLGAFANLCFNIGVGGLRDKNPKMLACAEKGDWTGAARELLDGPYKTQVGPRAFRLARQLREDRWV